jgi:lysozyme
LLRQRRKRSKPYRFGSILVSDAVEKPRMKVSREGVVLIKSLEGLRTRAAPRPDGGWTIGYGHTRSAREGAEVTEAEAELLLQYDLLPVVAALNDLVPARLNQHQFDALASFVFSVGVDRFIASDVLQTLNAGAGAEAADAMTRWPVRDWSVPVAARRRAAERALFTADPTRRVTVADLFTAPVPPPEPVVAPAPANDVDPPASDDRADARAQAVAMLLGETDQSLTLAVADPGAPGPQPAGAQPADEAAMMMAMLRYSAYGAPMIGPLPVAEPVPPVAAPAGSPAVSGAGPAQPDPPPLVLTAAPEAESPVLRPVWGDHDRPLAVGGGSEPLLISIDQLDYDPVLRHESTIDSPAQPPVGWGETGAFLVMGGVGVVSFGAAMAAFRLANQQDALLGETGVIGGVLALIGATCIGVSAWNLHRRWGPPA